MAARQSGVFQFTAADGNELFMSYHVLNVNDWFLLTLVPADLISGYADAYILRALLLIGGCVLAFGLLFLALYHSFTAPTAGSWRPLPTRTRSPAA